MTTLCLFFLVLCTLLPSPLSAYIYSPSLEEQEIEVTTNPHIFQDEVKGTPPLCLSVQHLLSPHLLMTHTLPTQQDTILNIRHAKVFTQPVPVYTMKQPARLNPSELKFDFVVVHDLMTKDGVVEIPVDPQASMDSWFPGFQLDAHCTQVHRWWCCVPTCGLEICSRLVKSFMHSWWWWTNDVNRILFV